MLGGRWKCHEQKVLSNHGFGKTETAAVVFAHPSGCERVMLRA